MGFSFSSADQEASFTFDNNSTYSGEEIASFRQSMAEKSATTKINSNVEQMKDISITNAQYSLNEVSGEVKEVQTVKDEGLINNITEAVDNISNQIFSMIDSALEKVGGLLGQVLKQTAMSEKINEIKSEAIGISYKLNNVANGINNKVKNLKSINDLIRYDNFAHTANRFSNKATTMSQNSSTLLSAVQTGTDIIGIANTILTSVNEGIKQLGVSFPSFGGILPELDMSKFIPPLPQISCPSLPSPPSIESGEKMDERNTVQAVKAVKEGIQNDMQNALSKAINDLASQIPGLSEDTAKALDSISSAISQVKQCMPQNMVQETLNGIDTLESSGSDLTSLDCYSKDDVITILDNSGLDENLNFSFNSYICVCLGLDTVDSRIQNALLTLSDIKTYIDTSVATTCDVNPSVDAYVGIPNTSSEIEEWLGKETPIVTDDTTIISPFKSTTEPLA